MEFMAIKNKFGVIGTVYELNFALGVAVQVTPDLTVLINGRRCW
jgi:hypothetical protein